MAQRLSRAGKLAYCMLRDAGFHVAAYEVTGSNHIRFVLELTGGIRRQIFCANTPSGRNLLAIAKRIKAQVNAAAA